MWAKKGYEVAEQQIELPVAIPAVDDGGQGSKLTLNDSKNVISIKGTDFDLEFDKVKGTFSAVEKDGENILQKDGGPMLHLWRAPHQKDDMWAYKDWEKNGLKDINWVTDEVKSTQRADNIIEIKVRALSCVSVIKHSVLVPTVADLVRWNRVAYTLSLQLSVTRCNC